MAASDSAAPFSYAQAAKRLSSSASNQSPGAQEKQPPASDAIPSANGAAPAEEPKPVAVNEITTASPKTSAAPTLNAHSTTTVKETSKTSDTEIERTTPALASNEPSSQSTEPSGKKTTEHQHPKLEADSLPSQPDVAAASTAKPDREIAKTDDEKDSSAKQEAPSPDSHVNVWQKRKEEQEAKAKAAAATKSTVTPLHSTSATPSAKTPTSTTPPSREKDVKPPRRKDGGETKDKKKFETRKGSRSNRSTDTEDVENLPPVADASAWPTPQHAQGEEMRKNQERERERSFKEKEKESSRDEKERTGSVRGREKWVPVPYVPSTVFATPLPRRGGKTGRGGNRSVSYAGPSSSAPSGGDGNERVGRSENHHGHNHHRGPTERKSSEKQLNATDKSAPATKEVKSNSDGDVAVSRNEAQPESHAHPHQRFHSLDRGSQKQEGDIQHSQHSFQHTSQAANGGTNITNSNQRESRPRSFRRSFNHNGNGGSSAPFHTVPLPSHPFPHGSKGYGRNNGRMGIRSPSLPALYSNPAAFMPPADMSMYGYPAVGIPHDPTLLGYSAFPGTLPTHPGFVTGSDSNGLITALSVQLEYYLSVDNLCKDIFLRKHMDSQGWVHLNVIASFKRMRDMTDNMEIVKSVFSSEQAPRNVEYKSGAECEDGIDRIRRRDTWQMFVLKMEDRYESARNDGPKPKTTGEEVSDQAEPRANEGKEESMNSASEVREKAPLAAAS